jgi:4-carboxymuconolactone decarboxylase
MGGTAPVNLYRVLANQPDVLAAWMDFARALRERCKLPRDLRELVIVHLGQVFGSEYEVVHHQAMARAAGVPEAKLQALVRWREAEVFSSAERAALAYAEGILDGEVADAVAAEAARWYSPSELVELAVTAGFYTMVPRVLEALRVPLEESLA